jgi:hypothetical protein
MDEQDAEYDNCTASRRSSQKQLSVLPSGHREERRRVVHVPHPGGSGEKILYRICHTRTSDCGSGHGNVLRIEISHGLGNLSHYIRRILECKRFGRLRIFVKYGEFVGLHDQMHRINEQLFACNYRFRFSFVPGEYRADEYVPLFDIEAIRRGEHYG